MRRVAKQDLLYVQRQNFAAMLSGPQQERQGVPMSGLFLPLFVVVEL